MKVVFDSQGHRLEKRGGVSRYVTLLGQALLGIGVDVKMVVPIHRNEYLRAAVELPQMGFFAPKVILHHRIEAMLNSVVESPLMRWANPDVTHSTYYGTQNRGGARARVLTVHDMIHERLGEWPGNPVPAMKARAVASADHIICISRATRDDLCEILNVRPEKTSIVYHGAYKLPLPIGVGPTPAEQGPFVLYVGQRYRYKNFDVLLDAFGQSRWLRSECRLIAFGGKPFSAAELVRAESVGIKRDRLIHLVGDDSLLAAHYASAHAFVYPSLYEGFGFPLLEAMGLGCPVITARTSCLPEIAGDGAIYFDPLDASDLAWQLERLDDDKLLRESMRRAGFERVRKFTWFGCASGTLESYKTALRNAE